MGSSSKRCLGAILIASFYFSASLAFFPAHHEGEGAHPTGHSPKPSLSPHFYRSTCPQADEIVVSVLKKAITKEPRIAASLLRLLFHDYKTNSTKLSMAHILPYLPSFVLCAAGVVTEVFSHDAWLE